MVKENNEEKKERLCNYYLELHNLTRMYNIFVDINNDLLSDLYNTNTEYKYLLDLRIVEFELLIRRQRENNLTSEYFDRSFDEMINKIYDLFKNRKTKFKK